MDLTQQAAKAKEDGICEVLRLLQHPEDLEKLAELRHEYSAKLKASKATLSSLVSSQVEATRQGIELLDKAHRHVEKLRGCLDSIYRLCAECNSLVDQQERITYLSTTHGNVQKVLVEIQDLIDLPDHADTALAMLDDPANLVPAYQALAVLEGTAQSARMAWRRNEKAAKHDMSSMMSFLERVQHAAAEFETLLFDYLKDYEQLAVDSPTVLVDCLRVVELQERLDKQCVRVRMDGFVAKRWRQRLVDLITRGVDDKFAELSRLAPLCGQPNKKLRYNQEGDVVTDAQHDYLGNLISITTINLMTGKEVTETDAAVLKRVELIEEAVFDEAAFLEAIVPDLYSVEADLADAYDHVSPCFPPSYNIFEVLFQMYHIQVAVVIDTIGQRAEHLSTKGSLKIMEFLRKYMESLRGFGIDEALVRLPVSPHTNPDLPPGIDMLMRCYVERMERNVTRWYNNILEVDMEYEPKKCLNGKLRTDGVTDFFRILNEEIDVIRNIDDHGEVMFNAAKAALKIMQGFQEEQTRVIRDPEVVLSFEMFCALLNNNVICYDQSLEFVEEVQEQLEAQYQALLDVEEVCRGFLDVAKEAARRVVGCVLNDAGMSAALKSLYSDDDWLQGHTLAVILATLEDYMQDVKRLVEDSFVKRVAEVAFEELVRRMVNIFIAGIPQVTDAMVSRMSADEDACTTYFSQYLRPDKMARCLQQLTDLRLLISADSVATASAAYQSALSVHSGFTLDVLSKVLDSRGAWGGWDKKQTKDLLAAAKEISKKPGAAGGSGGEAGGKKGDAKLQQQNNLTQAKSKGFFSFLG